MTDPDLNPIDVKALEWFVLMKEHHTEQQRRDFEQWVGSDPEHVAAYERARILWDRFDVVKPEYERMRRSGRIGRRAVVLGILATAVSVPTLLALRRSGAFADYVTDVAERRTISLPDGSSVELGGYSALSVDYSATARRLVLYRGQAFFRVARDNDRPFLVDAIAGTTQALGTEFDVNIINDEVIVSVIEHSVQVKTTSSAPVTVASGWQVSYLGEDVTSAKEADIDVAQAWRQDRIIFEDVPLSRVLAELERYRRGKILLMDNNAGQLPVTAIFDTRQASSALRTIEQILPVRVINAEGYVSLVYGRDP